MELEEEEENCSVDETSADGVAYVSLTVLLAMLLKFQLTVLLTVLLTMLLKLLLTPPCPGQPAGQSQEQADTTDGSLEADSSFLEANSSSLVLHVAMKTLPTGPDNLQVGDCWLAHTLRLLTLVGGSVIFNRPGVAGAVL